MGILDDAIREHLDLKRRQGAAEEELARLEDEAFGPPSRPGDPDFAERAPEGEMAGGPEGEATGNGGPEAATATEAPVFHDREVEPGTEETVAEAPLTAEPPFDAGEDVAEEAEAPVAEGNEIAGLTGEPTVEHDTLGDEGGTEDIDLDLDLDIEGEIEDAGELSLADEDSDEAGGDEAGGDAEPEASTATEEPIESLDTVEHHFEDAIDEAEVVEDDDLSLEDDSDDEDVLEETPEFLRDAPEDDELWFEQGEPKDFDF